MLTKTINYNDSTFHSVSLGYAIFVLLRTHSARDNNHHYIVYISTILIRIFLSLWLCLPLCCPSTHTRKHRPTRSHPISSPLSTAYYILYHIHKLAYIVPILNLRLSSYNIFILFIFYSDFYLNILLHTSIEIEIFILI